MKLDIKSIRCARTTIEVGKDEIYYALFVYAVKRGADGKTKKGDPAYWHVSDVQKFKKNGVWLCDDTHNISLPEDATDYIVEIGLFEMDNSTAREKMMKLGNGAIDHVKFPWDELEMPGSWTDPMEWVASILGWGKILFKHFAQDDPLGVNMLHFMPGNPNNAGSGELMYRKYRGKYNLNFELSE
jgi:hypothetical protein